MFKTTVNYTDLLDNKRSKALYFHIFKHKAERMALEDVSVDKQDPSEVVGGIQARIISVFQIGTVEQILELFDWLVKESYGVIEDDGETFVQSEEDYDRWTQSASYDAFMSKLRRDSEFQQKFVNGIFDLKEDQQNDPEYARHREELAKRLVRREDN